MGIVYNGNYFSFFETGRTELMRAKGIPYTEVEERGFMLPLTEAHINYKNPAKYDDILEIFAKLEYKNTATLKFEYEIKIGEMLIAT
jgi:acyl-CoA thioester hydrolase